MGTVVATVWRAWARATKGRIVAVMVLACVAIAAGGIRSAVALNPSMITTSAPHDVPRGQSFQDQATLNTGELAGGTITFNLYGPDDTTCAKPPAATSVVGVNGGSIYNSAPFFTNTLGVYRWVASYSGDADNASATGACGEPGESTTVGGTSTTIRSFPNPSAPGQSVTFTASVFPNAASAGVDGTVTFKDGSTALATVLVVDADASFTTSALAPGIHTITAQYNGSQAFLPSSAKLTQKVQYKTATTVTGSNPNPSRYGQPVTYTATVAPTTSGLPTPTGTVTFKSGATSLGTGSLVNGTATATSAALIPAGNDAITATYNGAATYQPSTSAVFNQNVLRTNTATNLSSPTANSSTANQPVSLTAKVTAVAPGAGTPPGTVSYYDGSAAIGTKTLSAGNATLTTSALCRGAHSLKAVYNDTANYNGSISAALSWTVNALTDTTSLASSLNPSTFGQSVTFTATVASSIAGQPIPTGTVTFKDGAAVLGTASLSSGVAKLTTSALGGGSHNITAAYGGSCFYAPSTSAALSQTVSKANTRATLTSSANPSQATKPVTFTATVVALSPGKGTPTGTVTFKDGMTALATVALGTDGKASLTTSALSVGTHAITAAYNGSANQNPSTSTALNQVVKYASTTALTSSPNPAANGDTIDFTAKVAPVSPGTATPTGTVKFTFGDGQAVTVGVVNGAATAQHYYRNPSIYQVTATYNGSTIYLTSSSPPISQQVT